jgi:hypothetical protein
MATGETPIGRLAFPGLCLVLPTECLAVTPVQNEIGNDELESLENLQWESLTGKCWG